MADILHVNEIFYTFQGEGDHMGKPALFVRLHGCAIKCPWCDSAGTWHPDYVPDNVMKCTSGYIVEAAKEVNAQTVVFTGGEPCHQDMTDVTRQLIREKIECHLETSGAFEIKGIFQYVIVSPKWARTPLRHNLLLADAWKIIVEDEHSIEKWKEEIGDSWRVPHSIWLHPEWSQRFNNKVLDSIVSYVKMHPHENVRAGYQIHKLYQADMLDARSRQPVPLGGDPMKGF